MKGHKNGLKTKLMAENPKAIYVHCYAHSLQLGIQDAVKSSQLLTNTLNVCAEVASLIRSSPKRSGHLERMKEAVKQPTVGIRSLCPTR